MPTIRAIPPLRGNLDQFPHVDTPGDACPSDGSLNVWPNAGAQGRNQMGRRPGLRKVFETKLGDGPVDCQMRIGRSVTATASWSQPVAIFGGTSITEETGQTVEPVPATGYAASVYNKLGDRLFSFEDPDYASASAQGAAVRQHFGVTNFDPAPNACFWTHVTKAYGGAIGNKTISRIHLITVPVVGPYYTAPIAHTFEVEDKAVGGAVDPAAVAIYVRAVVMVGPYVIALTDDRVYVFGYSTLGNEYLQRLTLSGNYAQYLAALVVSLREECIERSSSGASVIPYSADFMASRPYYFYQDDVGLDGPDEPADYADLCWLLAGYRGTTTVAGAVGSATNVQGNDIRSAWSVLRVNMPRRQATDYPTTPLQHGPAEGLFYGDAETKADNHGEANNIDFRPAEWFDTKGRVPICGCVIQPIAYSSSETVTGAGYIFGGVLALGHVNDGYNSDGDPPDGSSGYWNLLTINGNETDDRRQTFDVLSRRQDWDSTGFYSDKPWETDGTVNPSDVVGVTPSLANISRYANTDQLFVGGSFSDGDHVKLLQGRGILTEQATGPAWSLNLGEKLPVGGMAYGYNARLGVSSLVCCGKRNSTWDGASGSNASVWVVNPITGAISRAIDIGAGVNARMVAVSPLGGWFIVAHTHL